MKFKLHEFSNTTNLISGTIGNYEYSAKHFDEPSRYGINRGRVSMLEMKLDGKTIVNYNRGWDLEPIGGEIIEAFDELMENLESLPERFNAMEDYIHKEIEHEVIEYEEKWSTKLDSKISEIVDTVGHWFVR